MNTIAKARVAASVAVAALVGLSSSALARPDVRTLSCAEAQALVERNGTLVLTTGTHTYNRFVSGQQYCGAVDVAQLTYVATNDVPQCPVAYTCRQRTFVDR